MSEQPNVFVLASKLFKRSYFLPENQSLSSWACFSQSKSKSVYNPAPFAPGGSSLLKVDIAST